MQRFGAFAAAWVLAASLSVGPSASADADRELEFEPAAPGASAVDRGALEAEGEALARRWAPVFVQHVSAEHPERDRPLPIDFDGDWDATDNWQNLTPRAESTRPLVYGSAILTTTHAYLTYTLFFPRDWQAYFCVPYACHDNDLEVVLLVVERGAADAAADRLVLVETKAHRSYVGERAEKVARAPDQRPIIEVESEGHGMYAVEAGHVPEGDQRTFVHESAAFAAPSGSDAPLEHYELASLHATLWQRRSPRSEHGKLWIEGESGWLSYSGARQGRSGLAMGASMASREYAGGVRPPWALRSEGNRGDWFLDPALATLRRYRSWFPRGRPIGSGYALNPYLDDLKDECLGPACPPGAAPRATLARTFPFGGLWLALGLVSLRSRRRGARGSAPAARRRL